MIWIFRSEEVDEVAFAHFDDAWKFLQKKKSEIVFFDCEEEDNENQTYHYEGKLANGEWQVLTLYSIPFIA